jgi:uncharacterized protein DUF3606
MTDDKSKRAPQDRSRISLREDYEVQYWTEALGVTKDELARAVAKVGDSAAAVRRELGR